MKSCPCRWARQCQVDHLVEFQIKPTNQYPIPLLDTQLFGSQHQVTTAWRIGQIKIDHVQFKRLLQASSSIIRSSREARPLACRAR